jgi:hypothetical protein
MMQGRPLRATLVVALPDAATGRPLKNSFRTTRTSRRVEIAAVVAVEVAGV